VETADVCCPTCGEWFPVAVPPPDEQPCRVDYDCEVCCRPLVLCIERGEVVARGVGE
jgi:hypothetical protein